eukprot:Skav235843  [mRNA]  locus=scaffold1931:358179:370079:- [translate_table: standard]
MLLGDSTASCFAAWTEAIHFNLYKALASCAIVGLICAGLVIAGALPVFQIEAEIGDDLVTTHISIWCTMFSLVAMMASLTLSHDLLLCLGYKGPDVFLDKVCVDQFDNAKKDEGIHALTSYLWHTDELIVVLSEKYLDRIWTVFELISFFILRPSGKIDVLPVELATFVIFAAFCQSFRVMGELANAYFAPVLHPELGAVVWLVGGALFFVFCLALVLPMRRWGRVRSRLSRQMDTFTFASSSCQQESDREEILNALTALAMEHKIVDPLASTEEVCKVLEARAREVIPQSMHQVISELDPIAAEIYVGDQHVGLHLLYALLVAFSWPWFLALLGCATSFPPQGCVLESLILSVAGLVLAAYLFAGRVVRNLAEIHAPSAGEIAGACLLLAFEVICDQVGRSLLDRIFSLLGQRRCGALPLVFRTSCLPTDAEKEVSSLHEVDLELRKEVKELVEKTERPHDLIAQIFVRAGKRWRFEQRLCLRPTGAPGGASSNLKKRCSDPLIRGTGAVSQPMGPTSRSTLHNNFARLRIEVDGFFAASAALVAISACAEELCSTEISALKTAVQQQGKEMGDLRPWLSFFDKPQPATALTFDSFAREDSSVDVNGVIRRAVYAAVAKETGVTLSQIIVKFDSPYGYSR